MNTPAVEIVCPHCRGCASFHEPFRFHPARRYTTLPKNGHRWGRLVVEELYPEDFKWDRPESEKAAFRHSADDEGEGYLLNHHGMLDCPSCQAFEPIRIEWPQDAYWRWIAAGEILVARNKAHAQEIHDFLTDSQRPANRPPNLRHIKTAMLTAPVWPELAGSILRDLMAES